jgi:hypothetical protein
MIMVIAHGLSKSGKSTLVKLAEEKYGFVGFHPNSFRKDQLQRHYRCPDLDTPEGKSFIPNGMTIPMQQLMVDEYHFYAERDPLFTARRMAIDLPVLLTKHDRVIVQSIRNMAEVDVLMGLRWYFPVVIAIDRGQQGETSDEMTDDILARYVESGWPITPVHNLGLLSEYEDSLTEVLNSLI